MSKSPERAPDIVLFIPQNESDNDLVELISDFFKHVEVVNDLKQVCHLLLEPKSKLFIFLGDKLSVCLASYYKCIELTSKLPLCKHKKLAGITKDFENEAFQAFQDLVIDDYLVCRPVYAKTRVVQIIQYQLQSLKISDFANYSVANFMQASTHYPDELRELIQRGMHSHREEHEGVLSISEKICDALDTALARVNNKEMPSIDYDKLLVSLLIQSGQMPLDRSETIKQKTVELLHRSLDHLKSSKILKEPMSEQFIPSLSAQKDSYQRRKTELQNQDLRPKVLIIEDDMLSLQLSKTLLRQAGARSFSASSADAALKITDANRFDLILLDINLPDRSGVTLINDILIENKPNAETPIVMLTGNTTKLMVDEAIVNGAKAYLVKPLKSSTIQKLFRRFKVSSGL